MGSLRPFSLLKVTMSQNTYFRPINGQAITVGVTSAQCATAFAAQTSLIRLATGAVGVFYRTGANPTALVTDPYLPPNWTEYITATPGEKIACIQPTSPSGTFSVSELTN